MEDIKQLPIGVDEELTVKNAYRSLWYIFRCKLKMWEGCRFLAIELPLNAGEVEKIIPWGMKLSDRTRGLLTITRYPKTLFTCEYNEAAIWFHVRTPFGTGLHNPWMVVDDDTALIYGREILAHPKKMADIRFEEKDGKINAVITRRGTELVSVEAYRGEEEEEPEPLLQRKVFNVGGGGQIFGFINPIWHFHTREIIHESYRAEVTLSMNHSVYDPVKRFFSVLEPLSARMLVTDLMGTPYIVPVGLAGFTWFRNTYNLRFR